MSLDRNGNECQHNVTEIDDDGELYCVECGDVMDMESRADMLDAADEDREQQA